MSGSAVIERPRTPAPAAPGRTSRRSSRARQVPYWLLAPALVVYAVVILYPNLAAAVYAFTDWSGAGDSKRFVGLDNFGRLFTERGAPSALIHTLVIAAAVTVVQSLIGLGLATALNQPIRFRTTLRAVFFVPVLLPPVVVAFLWQYLLTPDGAVNQVLSSAGLGALESNWLGDTSTALGSVIAVIIWQNVGVSTAIFLAGLQSVPAELIEAAQIDGAGPVKTFRLVTLPLLAPSTLIVLSVTLVSSLKVFDQPFAMTGGGPGYATETMSLLMYKEGFVSLDYGYSTAIALMLTAVIFVLAMLQFRGLRRFQVEA